MQLGGCLLERLMKSRSALYRKDVLGPGQLGQLLQVGTGFIFHRVTRKFTRYKEVHGREDASCVALPDGTAQGSTISFLVSVLALNG